MLINYLCQDDFSLPLRARMGAFLRTMVEGYLESIRNLKKPDKTNWQSLRVDLSSRLLS
jgi:hypothetical protein